MKLRREIGICSLASPASRRRGERRVVGQRRVAADAVVVLHPTLGRQPVVVPPHRVEHLAAAHPLVARDQVGVRVGEHVPDVQRPADRRRRRVDRVDLLARLGAVEAVGAVVLPYRHPALLEAVERRFLGHAHGVGHAGESICGRPYPSPVRYRGGCRRSPASSRSSRRAFPTRMVPDLDRITDLMDLLGQPQRAYPSIHLTGTNGKTTPRG